MLCTRSVRKILLIFGCFFSLNAAVADGAFTTVFYKKVTMTSKPNEVQSFQFTARPGIASRIIVSNGSGESLMSRDCSGLRGLNKATCVIENLVTAAKAVLRVDSGEIKLNGKVIIGPTMLNKNSHSVQGAVTLTGANKIEVRLKGSRLSYVTIRVVQDSQAPNQLPVASITSSIGPNGVVSFDGSGSVDSDGQIISYDWEFGDGATSSGIMVTHQYATGGTFSATLRVTDNRGGQAAQSVSITIIPNTTPIAVLSVNKTEGVAPLSVYFDASGSSDFESSITYEWNFGDGQSGQGAKIAHEFLLPGDYTVVLTVTDTGGLSAQKSVVIRALNPELPPDPAEIAPPLAQNVTPSFDETISFLYEGANAIQKNVVVDKIEADRVILISGRVLNENGSPLPGVRVTDPLDDGYGSTLTRQDGRFNFVVNGGGVQTLEFSRNGYFSAQRQITSKFNESQSINDIVMIRPDVKFTRITSESANVQVAQSSEVSDSDGTRTGTLLIPAGTETELIMPNGSRRSIDSLTLRMTEYTVGENGPKRMPAELPPTSAYTYAFELSADEAQALGAEHIEFSKPVAYYVDNFLEFRVGGVVPVGVYDRQKQAWIPQKNGRVIKVLDIVDGKAVLDVMGSGQPATATELDVLAIDSDELSKLADLFVAGKSLWRVTTQRFSPVDLNWLSSNARQTVPNNPDPKTVDNPRGTISPNMCSGSIVIPEHQVLGERINLVGVPTPISYWSDRAPGRLTEQSIEIVLSGFSISPAMVEMSAEVLVAGRTETFVFQPQFNKTVQYTWDGLDAFGRKLPGKTKALVKVSYFFESNYLESFNLDLERVFGLPGVAGSISSVNTRGLRAVERVYEVTIGNSLPYLSQSIGGWNFDIHHFYDKANKTLIMGNGQKVSAGSMPRKVRTVAGTGERGLSGNGGLASNARFNYPNYITARRDGSLAVADFTTIREIDRNGIINRIAGGGNATGEGVPALSAYITQLGPIAESPDGSLYFVDASNKIRKIKNGLVYTVVGTGVAGFSGDGGLAVNAQIAVPYGIVFSNDGSFYFSDTGNSRIRRVGTDGIIHTIAGNGTNGFSGDGGPALDASLSSPLLIGMDGGGNLYISDGGNSVIRRISPDGSIQTVIGVPRIFGYNGDGIPANTAYLNGPYCAVVGRAGEIYICDGSTRIRKVSSDGVINTIAGTGALGTGIDDGLAGQTPIGFVLSLAIGPQGEIYFADPGKYVIRMIEPLLGASNIVPSSDGSEIFLFAEDGRHIETRFAKTNALKYKFTYDSNNRLTGIEDSFSNLTQVIRQTDGTPTRIISPYGQKTELTLDANGMLSGVTNPLGETNEMSYTANGLMTSFKNPRGAVSTFSYDNVGRLTRDSNANNGFLNLLVSFGSAGQLTQLETAERTTSSTRFTTSSIGVRRENRPASAISFESQNSNFDGNNFSISINQMRVSSTLSADPRLGTAVMYDKSKVTRFPNNAMISDVQTVKTSAALAANQFQDETTTNENGRISRFTYNSANKTSTFTSPEGRVSTSIVNLHEQPIITTAGNLAPLNFSYDSRGRLELTTRDNRRTQYVYDSDGRLSQTIDAANRSTRYEFNLAGRLLSTELPDGRVIDYEYDSRGNLTSVTPPGRPAHTTVFDLLENPISYNPPAIGGPVNTTYSYNLENKITSVVRPDGQSATYNYQVGRGTLSNIVTPQGPFTYQYDSATGRLRGQTSPDSLFLNYFYNGDLLTTVTTSGNRTMTLAYTAGPRLSSQSFLNQTIAYSYDRDNLLTGAGDMTLFYDAANPLLQSTQVFNVADQYGYNQFGELTAYEARAPEPIYQYALERDQLGRIVIKTEVVAGLSTHYEYQYDLAGRLAQVKMNGAISQSYAYDSNGNRVGGTYDVQDRLLSNQSFDYVYNQNGDLYSKTNKLTSETTFFSYDVFGNLKQVNLPSGQVIRYQIYPTNQRARRLVNGAITHEYFFDQTGRLIHDGFSRFVYGSKPNTPDYMIRGGVTYRIISDERGSVRLVVNATSGAVAQRMDYDEFGAVLADSSPGFQPFGFAGGLYDNLTGLVRFGARDYDPETGRWTSKDPIRFQGGDTNLYGYVLNDPINLVDPTGLFNVPGAAVGLITGAIGGYTTGGGWGAVAGSVAGGVVGGIVPTSSGAVGAAAGGAVANLVGQILGNGAAGTSFGNIDVAQVIAAGFGGATGAAITGGLGVTGVVGQSAICAGVDAATTAATAPFSEPVDFCLALTGKRCSF